MGKQTAKKHQIRRRFTESPPLSKSIRFGRRLSDDLIEQSILPLLPASSLLRFQFVSTRWHHLIVDPYFVLLHSRIQTSPSPTLLLYTRKIEKARFFDPETRSPLEVESFRRRIYDQFGYGAGYVVASCSGLVCMSCHGHNKWKLVVGNPLLRDWKLIPAPPCDDKITHNTCGLVVYMGESDVTCKLVVFSRTQLLHGTGFDQVFHVFTSSTGLWETIQERVDSLSYTEVWPATGNVACVRGILYSMCQNDYLMWFDPKNMQSGYEPLPPRTPTAWYGGVFNTFGEWNGDLSYTRAMAMVEGIEIWSMTDHCKPCWTLRYTLSFNTIIGDNLCFAGFDEARMVTAQLMPFGGGNVMFWIEGVLYNYNVWTCHAHNLLKGSRFDSCHWILYHRSLVLWPNRVENRWRNHGAKQTSKLARKEKFSCGLARVSFT